MSRAATSSPRADVVRAARNLCIAHPPHRINPDTPWVINTQRGSLHSVSPLAAFILENIGDGASYEALAHAYARRHGEPLTYTQWEDAIFELRRCSLIQ